MDARSLRIALTLGAWLLATSLASAATWKTDNFVVTAPTEALAKKVAFTAEQWRIRLAKEWLGKTLPKWYRPCPVTVNVGQIGAGGATTFRFSQGQVYDWRMNVQGTEERILDSVIPHEVSHTIFASHFRRGLPRWADEGAATLAEHEVEQLRQAKHLKQVWNTSHKIPLGKLLSMEEYPEDMRDVMTLYAQGYSLADFLVQKGGKARYLKLLELADKQDWETALRELYGIEGVSSLDSSWGSWVIAGSPPLDQDRLVAMADAAPQGAQDDQVVRGQSPDEEGAPEFETGLQESSAPERTAALDDFTGFLPPQPQEAAMSESADSKADDSNAGDGKAPRPAPLPAYSNRESAPQSGQGRATETSSRSSDPDRRALPRTIRAQPASTPSEIRDFFANDGDEKTGAPRRMLGQQDFPKSTSF